MTTSKYLIDKIYRKTQQLKCAFNFAADKTIQSVYLVFDGGILRIGDKILKAASQCSDGSDHVRGGGQLVGPELQHHGATLRIMQSPQLDERLLCSKTKVHKCLDTCRSKL